MAGPVRLSDVVIPEVYMTYQTLNTPELTEIFQSGIVASNDLLNNIARSGGKTCVVPFWKDLDSSLEPDMSNDDPADFATPDKVGTGQMQTRKAFMHKAWASMDLIVELSGAEPIEHIRNRFGTWWNRQWQRRIIAMLLGLYRANVAKNGGDMVVDISGQAGALGVFNSDAAIDANGTMGDAAGQFSAIFVHSRIRQRMVKNEEIVYISDANGKLNVPTYKGLRVIVDDAMPILSGNGDTAVYLSAVVGGGAFGYGSVDGHAFALGEGIPKKPAYVIREELAGNGGGEEIIGERKTQILHPQGWTWTEPTGADALVEFSPTIADLAKAAPWSRVVSRKQLPFAFIISRA